jgi:hypothetical protein
VTLVEAIAFVRECRDTHVPAAEGAAAGVEWPGGDAAFHRDCIRGYDEVLEALERSRRLLEQTFGPLYGAML